MGGIQEIYGRDPGNIWEGSRKYMGGIQEIYGRDPGNILEGFR